jgi:hypothetical protein
MQTGPAFAKPTIGSAQSKSSFLPNERSFLDCARFATFFGCFVSALVFCLLFKKIFGLLDIVLSG